ncbi:MAG: TetR/AcrR family transcriptional regulator [Sandaracinaceae bacterium]|nr:TetR/AcrR family transcriptional regulator [Myxococcales bacterium]MCB9656515.1 TetR/AcrR family transcriptional regulator [Sandaracinaceae bacterium]
MSEPSLRERKKHEVRERLCQEARRLLAASDDGGVSVEQIAEAAGVSRATFFNYFPSKGALLDELARRMTGRHQRYLAEVSAEGEALEPTLVRWFARSVQTVRRSEATSRLLFGRAFAGAEENELRAAQMADVHRAYADLLRTAQVRGEVAVGADVSFYAEMMAGAMTALLNNWFNDPSYPLEARAEQTARFLASAIAADHAPSRNARAAQAPSRAAATRRASAGTQPAAGASPPSAREAAPKSPTKKRRSKAHDRSA